MRSPHRAPKSSSMQKQQQQQQQAEADDSPTSSSSPPATLPCAPPTRVEEKELMTGVYITDYRHAQTAEDNARGEAEPEEAPASPQKNMEKMSPLELRRHELENTIRHLERSQQELRECLDAEGPDAEFEAAISENQGILAQKRRELERVVQQIAAGGQ